MNYTVSIDYFSSSLFRVKIRMFFYISRFKLNIWDVGGQKSLRSYWRNYFESTDGLMWVVDSADRRRLMDCKQELHSLLLEEVQMCGTSTFLILDVCEKIMKFCMQQIVYKTSTFTPVQYRKKKVTKQ